jgi:prolyl oligopeptidase
MTMESKRLPYTPARREAAQRTIGPVTYEDPYGWLEDDTPEALAWGASEDALTRRYLREWPHYQTIREQQAGTGFLYHSLSWSGPVPCGGNWLSVVPRRQAYPQLRISTTPFGPGDVIFDPDTLPPGTPRALRGAVPSPDGQLVAVYLVKEFGPDTRAATVEQKPQSLRFIDLERRQLLPDRLHAHLVSPTNQRRDVWLPDSRTFYYVGYDSDGVQSGGPRIFCHRVGDPPPAAPDLDDRAGALQISQDGRYLAALLGSLTVGQPLPVARYIKELPSGRWRPFLTDVAGRCQGVFVGDRYVAITTEAAPKGRVVSIPVATPSDRSTWTEMIPEGERVIGLLSRVQDRLVIGFLDDNGYELALTRLDGTPEAGVLLPPGGISGASGGGFYVSHSALTPCAGGFSFMHGTFASLPSFYRFHLADHTLERINPPIADLGPLCVKVVHATGGDGARIPIRLVYRPDVDISKPQPVLLSGYGNLNFSYFDPPAWYMPFLNAGGVYAWATLRGDGVFGTEWWAQGRGKNKGQSSLDFVAAAEFLVRSGIAAKDRLAIAGFSGGGMLTIISLARRPDLFRAVASIGGLCDFFRLRERFHAALGEWGDATDPETADAMLKWSPYQNVRQDQAYPATFLACLVSEVGWSGQGRKMAAALRHASSSDAPILYRAYRLFWHGETGAISGENGPDSGEVAIDLTAFIMRELGMIPRALAAVRGRAPEPPPSGVRTDHGAGRAGG